MNSVKLKGLKVIFNLFFIEESLDELNFKVSPKIRTVSKLNESLCELSFKVY